MQKIKIFPLFLITLLMFLGFFSYHRPNSVNAINYLVTNTNDSGPGSLRDVLIQANSNCVGGSITFDWPSLGAATFVDASNKFYTINITSTPLPDITCPNLILNGSSGNSNALMLGAGGNVGVDQLVLSKIKMPMINIVDGLNVNYGRGLYIRANAVTVQGIAIHGFSDADIKIEANSGTINNNLIGSSPNLVVDTTNLSGFGVRVDNSFGSVISTNYLHHTGDTGVILVNSHNSSVVGNNADHPSIITPTHDGIEFAHGSSNNNYVGNLIQYSGGEGIDSFISGDNNFVSNNTVYGSGQLGVEGTGIRITNGNYATVTKNVVFENLGSGIIVTGTDGQKYQKSTGTLISQNSIYDNNIVGIDLVRDGSSINENDFGDGLTFNEYDDLDNGGNDLTNYPVLENGIVPCGSDKFIVSGWSRPNANIEFFIADVDPTGFGEGKTYILSKVEGSIDDLDSSVSTYGPGAINNLIQGSDNTNRFRFILPIIPGISVITPLTSTATTGRNTSEFSANMITTPACVGLAKQVTNVINNHDGSYDIDYRLKIENMSNFSFDNLKLQDNLSQTFNGSSSFELLNITSQDLTINPNYNGQADTNILTGTDSLSSQQISYVDYTVRLVPGKKLGVYENYAEIDAVLSGTGNLIHTTDISNDGTLVDPDGDGDSGNNNIPTPLNLTEHPIIGIAKQAEVISVDPQSGEAIVQFNFKLANMGDIPLNEVGLIEDLQTVFAGNSTWSVVPNSLTSNDFQINSGFDGQHNLNLLASGNNLNYQESGILSFRLSITPTIPLLSFQNQVLATAKSPSGAVVEDLSTDGINPDPDNDGNPNNNQIPTPIDFNDQPSLGVAKNIGIILDKHDGSFDVPINIIVKNYGPTTLKNLQITDNLTQTFPNHQYLLVPGSINSNNLTINPNYDGVSNFNLLAGTDLLSPGESKQIDFVINLQAQYGDGPFLNTAVATAIGLYGTQVSDQSQNGTDPDHDGNGNPGDDNEPSLITLPDPSTIDLELMMTGNINQYHTGDGITYQIEILNKGPLDATGVVVKVNLPVGVNLSNILTPIGTSYDAVTGLWQIGNLISGESKNLSLEVKTDGVSLNPLSANTEVYAANETDVDSTPNNNVLTEDDIDLVSINLLIAVPPPSLTTTTGGTTTGQVLGISTNNLSNIPTTGIVNLSVLAKIFTIITIIGLSIVPGLKKVR